MFYWIHAEDKFIKKSAVKSAMKDKSSLKWPNNVLSITENLAVTEVIIKMGVDDPAWIADNVTNHANVIRVHTEVDHGELRALVHTPAWKA